MRLILYPFLAFLLLLASTDKAQRSSVINPAPAQRALHSAADSLSSRLRIFLTDTIPRSATPLPLPDRSAVQAFYAQRTYAPAWSNGSQPSAAGRAALLLLAQAEDYGLLPSRYHVSALQTLVDSLTQPATPGVLLVRQVRLEVLLTDGLLRFTRHLRRGQLHAFTPSPLENGSTPFQPVAWVTAALAAPDFAAALLRCQPPQREYQQLQQALARWRRQPTGPDSLAHRRRTQQLALTLERWRWAAIPDADYVLVNLPAYALEVVHQGRVQQTHRLVIGKPTTPTPTLSSHLTTFTLAPEWRVPNSIATKEILPHLQASTTLTSEHDFLSDNNYTLYNTKGQAINPATVNWKAVTARHFPYTIRQKAGCDNALGNIIFRFANPYSVYLHATSNPTAFARSYRALGHGCMRMEYPMRLAAYLLGPDSIQARLPSEAECEASPLSRSFTLKHPMPLHVRYATCAVVAGKLQFYADVYGRDKSLRRQLFGN